MKSRSYFFKDLEINFKNMKFHFTKETVICETEFFCSIKLSLNFLNKFWWKRKTGGPKFGHFHQVYWTLICLTHLLYFYRTKFKTDALVRGLYYYVFEGSGYIYGFEPTSQNGVVVNAPTAGPVVKPKCQYNRCKSLNK